MKKLIVAIVLVVLAVAIFHIFSTHVHRDNKIENHTHVIPT